MTTSVSTCASGPVSVGCPKFSVVVPTLNAAHFLNDCLRSIAVQGQDTEVIVVDGGSTDRTLGILEVWQRDPRMRLTVLNRLAKGEANAINEGLKMATGDIVAWLDADDVYAPKALHRVALALRVFHNQWCYGGCHIINANGEEVRQAVTRFKEWWQMRYSYGVLKRLCFIAQPATFWTREALMEVGYLDENERYVMDYDYWLRLGRRFKPVFIPHYLAGWRSHPGSETARALLQDIEDARRISKKYGGGIGADLTYWGVRLGYKMMGVL